MFVSFSHVFSFRGASPPVAKPLGAPPLPSHDESFKLSKLDSARLTPTLTVTTVPRRPMVRRRKHAHRQDSPSPSSLPGRRSSSVSLAGSAECQAGEDGWCDGCDDDSSSASSCVLQRPERRNGFLCFDALNLQSTGQRNERMKALGARGFDRQHYGVTVAFSDEFHLSAPELEPYRRIGDPEMDLILEERPFGATDDVIEHAALSFADGETSLAAQFYEHYLSVPDWVDFDQLQRGIDVFLAYAPVAGCALFYRSLTGGFSIPQIVEVLVATKYLIPTGGARSDRDKQRTMERLIDTGGMLACCFAPTADVDHLSMLASSALRPKGRGWVACLRVRALHAKVRRSLLKSNRWNSEKNGVPINQEDLCGTLLAFSVNVLTGIEIVLGQQLPECDQRDYLALWRYIGWLLGVDTLECTENGKVVNSNPNAAKLPPIDPCGPSQVGDDSILHAYATLESIILHLLHPEENAAALVEHLLSLRRFVSFRSEVCRIFLGGTLADKLRIAKTSVDWTSLRRGQPMRFAVRLFEFVCIKFFVLVFMCSLRFYTLMTFRSSWFRRSVIKWHGNFQLKFLSVWSRTHQKRMNEATLCRETKSKVQSCPFAMVMDPSREQDHTKPAANTAHK